MGMVERPHSNPPRLAKQETASQVLKARDGTEQKVATGILLAVVLLTLGS